MGPILAIVCFAALVFIVRQVEGERPVRSVLGILVFGYVLRLLIQFNLDNIEVFSYGGVGLRGDSVLYETQGSMIAMLWRNTGIGPVDNDLIPQFEATTLPGYLYGFIIYLNDGKTLLGCVSVVAMLACLTCFNLFRLAIELGADERIAARIMTILLFSPGFLLFTSDTTKDGLVAFFVTSALATAFRISTKITITNVVLGLCALAALWFTRFYLVFVASLPLVIGVQGVRSKVVIRPLLTLIAAFGVLLIIGTYTNLLGSVATAAQSAFNHGSDADVLAMNAGQGSGVTFDDGGNPFNQLPLKLAYTIFSPFPWANGSVAFQLAKIDVFVWYYLLYRAYLAVKERLRTQPVVVFMFLSFIGPLTIAYATSMANVGLIYRQRIPVVMVTSVLAALSFPARGGAPLAPVGPAPAPRPLLNPRPFRPAHRRDEAERAV